VLFLFGGALMSSVLGEDHSMVAAISAVFAIGLMHVGVSELKRWSPRFGRLVDGTPVFVYEQLNGAGRYPSFLKCMSEGHRAFRHSASAMQVSRRCVLSGAMAGIFRCLGDST
jgi:hypothetical protein